MDTNGDIKLADSFDTQLAMANFWLRTDNGGYAAAFDVGCNLGEFIGSRNTEETLEEMRDQAYDSLILNVFFPEDIQVEAVPLDIDEALVAVQIRGEYVDKDAKSLQVAPQILTYIFPYIDGVAFPNS